MGKEFLKQIQATIERYQMLQSGDKVIVGVSGGPDSIALLFALHQLKNYFGISLLAAHYNHKLRGFESDREAELAKFQAEKIGVPLLLEEDDGSLLQVHRNVEESARKKRYDFFQRKAKELSAQRVALGHTANDQAETFFLWMLRGTGTKGLGGIPPVRDGLFIRPLIDMERKEILKFLQQEGVPWIEDSSNQKTSYFRNQIRHILLPKLLHEFSPNLIEKISKTTEILRDEELFMEKLCLKKFNELKMEGDKKELCFEISKLNELPLSLKRRILRYAIKEIKGSLRRINFAHMEAIVGIMKSPSPNLKISLPGSLKVYKEYDRLRFALASKGEISFYQEFNILPKEIRIPEIERKIEIEALDWDKACLLLMNKNFAFIDFEKLKFPLIVRNWRKGDRFQPLGTRGFKKVKDFLIDIKLPLDQRKKIPIVFFGDFIAWIVGQRIDDRVKVTNSTKKVIKMLFI